MHLFGGVASGCCYCNGVLFSLSNIHLNLIESVQRKFSKYLPNLADIPYSERCSVLNLQPLYVRRIVLDMTMLFKIIRGLTHFPYNTFEFTERQLHNNHIFDIRRFTCTKDLRLFSFHPRVVKLWNALSPHVVTSQTLQCFSSRLRLDPAFLLFVATTAARLKP